jgi:transposase-like protein
METGKRTTSFEQRVAIRELAQAGQTDAQVAQALRLSVSVVRKWRRRARAGRAGLLSPLGRPARGVLSSYAAAVRDKLETLRHDHPGWGPLTLQAELAHPTHGLRGRLPGRTQIAAFLKAKQLTRAYLPRQPLEPAVPPVSGPHGEWQLDAQGPQTLAPAKPVVIINIGDPYSRVLTESLACLQIRKAALADYQCALRRAFLRFGLPAGLSLDHDTVFHDPTSASPYPSRLHLWLLALGINVRFIAVARPTQHGFIERTHQVITHQVLDDRTLRPANLQVRLDARTAFLNSTYPNRALGGQPPLRADPRAAHTGRAYTPEREAALLDCQRVYAYLAPQTWYRRVTAKGQFELGTFRYGLGLGWGQPIVQIRFDPQTLELICQSLDQRQTRRLPARGLTPADWAGELDLDRLPTYQLAFDWTPADRRRNLLFNHPTGTTFPDN